MSAPTHAHSPERQQQLAQLKLLWLLVAEELGTWPDQFKPTTRLVEDLGLRGAEAHHLSDRLRETFAGLRLEPESHFGARPASLASASFDRLLRRTLALLKRLNLYPAPLAQRLPSARPLTLADLGALVLAAHGSGGTDAIRLHSALEHDLVHWARHLQRPGGGGIGSFWALFNRSRALRGED